MFSLVSGCWQFLLSKTEYYVLILGLDNAGKTTILEQVRYMFSNNGAMPQPGKNYRPTVGLNVGRVEVGKAKLILWDLGGQEALRSIWPKYYHGAHSIIYLVDSSDAEHLEESREELAAIVRHPELRDVPILVLANKQDLRGSSPAEVVEASLSLAALSPTQAIKIQPTAAISGQGINEGISWFIDVMQTNPRTTI